MITPVTVHDDMPGAATRTDTDPDTDTGTRYARAADLDELAQDPPAGFDAEVRLLPGFDQWVLGPGTDEASVLSPRRRAQVSRAAGWIAPVVVHGGRVVGTWEDEGAEPTWFADERTPSEAALRDERDRRRRLPASATPATKSAIAGH